MENLPGATGVAFLAALCTAPTFAQDAPWQPSAYCRPFPRDRMQPAPGGFLLLDQQGRDDGRAVPRADRPSPDHQFWICQRAGEPVGVVLAPAASVSLRIPLLRVAIDSSATQR